MFFPKAVFCRVFQAAFRMALPVLPYRQPPLREAPASLPEIIRKNPLPRSGHGAEGFCLRYGCYFPSSSCATEKRVFALTLAPGSIIE